MKHPTPPASTPLQRRRAFTLIELIVVVVVLAVLVGIAAFGYRTVTAKAHDAAARRTVEQVAKSAAGQAAAGSGVLDTTVFQDAAADAAVATGALVGGDHLDQVGDTVTLAAGPGLSVVTGPSTKGTELSVGLSPDGSSAGLALRSATGSCAVAVVAGTKISSSLWAGDRGASCSGAVVLSSGVDANVAYLDPAGSTVATPTGLVADPAPACVGATLRWDPVPAAVGYQVFVDGASTPAWTGAATTARLDAVAAGTHDYTVTATDGTATSAESAKVTATTTTQNNDNFANACSTPAGLAPGETFLSADFDNTGATTETGEEPNAVRTLWWNFTPTVSGNYTLSMADPTTGTPPGTRVLWLFTGSAVNALTSLGYTTESTVENPRAWYLTAGTTYRIRGTNSVNAGSTPGRFRLKISRGPGNDNFAGAYPVTDPGVGQSWISADATNVNAGFEPGENTSWVARTVWWKFTPTQTGAYTFSMADPTSSAPGPLPGDRVLWIYSGTTLGGLTVVANPSGTPGEAFYTVRLAAGTTYYARAMNSTNPGATPGWFRLRMTRAPASDEFVNAVTAGVPAVGSTWLSGDYDNTGTSTEPGEPNWSARSMWFKFTPATSGSYTLSMADPTAGTKIGTRVMWVYTGSSVNALTQVGMAGESAAENPVTLSMSAGTTYYIRTANSQNANSTPGGFQLKIRH